MRKLYGARLSRAAAIFDAADSSKKKVFFWVIYLTWGISILLVWFVSAWFLIPSVLFTFLVWILIYLGTR